MKKEINIAIVAFGSIAKSHLLGAYMANVKLDLPFALRVSHIITSRPSAVPYKDIKVFATLNEALADDEEIDIIDICNINQAHLKIIETAVEAGKAIYCEKPLAEDLAGAQQALQLVEENGLQNGVPLIFRYLPCLHLLKDEITNKTLGDIIHFEATFYHNSYLNELKRKTWRTDTSAGGGTLLDLGVHMMDCIRVVFGEAEKVCNTSRIYFPDVKLDEISETNLCMQSGAKGRIVTSRIYHQKQQKVGIEVFCEHGSFLCDFAKPYELEINEFQKATRYEKKSKGSIMDYVVSEHGATQYHLDAHMAAIADFAHKVFDNTCSGFGADFKEACLSQSMLYREEKL